MSARNHGFFYRFRTPLKIFGVLVLIALGLGGAYFMSLLGPRDVSEADLANMGLSQEQILEMVDEAESMQDQFKDISLLREPTKEDIDLLKNAVQKYRDAMEAAGGADREIRESLEAARKEYHNAAAKGLMEESRAREAEIGGLSEDDDEGRIALYDQAIELQKEINSDYSLSDNKDMRRLARLVRERDSIKARPLYLKSLEAEERAQKAMDEGNWTEADTALSEAIDTQKKLNADYRELQYADIRRISRLERELTSMESALIYDKVRGFEEAGNLAMEEKRYREAAASFVKASRAQEELNREYPGSRFASLSRAEDFRGMQETALGTELSMEILEGVKELDVTLNKRMVWEATGQIQSLAQQIEQFTATYPRNDTLGEAVKTKITFLGHIQNDLALLQDRIYGQLIPVPEDENGWHMTRTEISQALFSSIMLNNPSRNRGELFPVDSVTWDDAKEFCQKVSWLLGREVRLPTQEEFMVSVGKLRYVNLDEISWNQQNSDGFTHEVGTKEANFAGFYDLLGNVAEWLESPDLPGNSEAYLAGGSAETSIDRLVDKPVEIYNRRTRNRMNGFRIAVNLDK